jgi:DNA-binding transcriptional LysR family regulator
MELRHLRYFVAVAEELHFGRAARRLGVAQPPLSQQIRGLEEELGIRLFHRTSRRVELSAEGRVFLEQARLVLTQAQRAGEIARAAGRGEAGGLGIGFVTSAVFSLLPAILREFHARHPRVEMRCRGIPPSRQLDALRRRELDVAIVRTPVREEGLCALTLFNEPLVAVLPADHALAARRGLRVGDLAGAPFISMGRETAPSFHGVVTNACHRAGFSPDIAHEVVDLQTVLALVAAGLGVSLVPESLALWGHPGVAYRELPARTPRVPLELVWRRESPQPIVDAFVAAAQAVAARSPGPGRSPEKGSLGKGVTGKGVTGKGVTGKGTAVGKGAPAGAGEGPAAGGIAGAAAGSNGGASAGAVGGVARFPC